MVDSVMAMVQHIASLKFNATLPDGRSIELESANEKKSSFSPIELFLISVAGCTAMDIQWIMERQRQKLSTFEISVHGIRRDDDPRYFETIDLEYILAGEGLRKDAVERAIRLSQEKYCSVRAMLNDKVKINATFKVLNGEEKT